MADYQININAKDNTKGAMNSISAGLGGLSAKAGKFKAALGVAGGALAAFGAASKVQDTIDDFDALAKRARAAGSAAGGEAFKNFQILGQAMNEAGIDAGMFDRAMLQTTSRLQKGLEGGKGFAEIVDKLGSSVVDSNGNLKDGATVMQEMINALNAGTISTDEFAKVVGGRAGPMIQAQFASLQDGAGGLAATLADVAENSNIVDLDAAQNAEKFNDTVGRMGEKMSQLLTNAITPLLPHLTRLADQILANMPAIIEKVSAGFERMQPIFSLLGTVINEIIWPGMQRLFQVLGFVADNIAPLVEAAIPGLQAGFEILGTVVERIVGFFVGAAQALGDVYDKAVALKDGVVGVFESAGDGITSATDKTIGAVKGAWDWLSNDLVENSVIPDMFTMILAEFNKSTVDLTSATSNTTSAISQDFGKLSETIEKDFVGSLKGALDDGKLSLNDFEGFFSNTLTNMLNSALDSGGGFGGIFSSIGSAIGGGSGGGIFSSIGSAFGGFFADGGQLGAGKWGIAGEAGPEVISGPARITPMDEMTTSGGAPVTINIQAIDTQTGTEFLLNNRKQIEGIIQTAYNKQGKRGIY